MAPFLITTAQTLLRNDVTSARWQHPYLGYFDFIFVQWEEVEMRHPSVYAVYIQPYLTSAAKNVVSAVQMLPNQPCQDSKDQDL